MTPSEFSKLTQKKQSHHLTLLYFKGKCFKNGRPIADYFKVRATFLKAKQDDLNEMYLFLSISDSRPPLKELWNGCKLWNQERMQNHKASDYKPIGVDELLKKAE